ncbi:MAG: hypothetical protein NTY81_01460 [Candidatus Staskawiczbacteria bacterium]|nr:hypothetical protein [Candidatus Staskawiczbacteria bacterium]
MVKKIWIIIVWVLFAIISVLFFSANHYFPKGEMYPTGDIVCQNDDRGPCGEKYKEDVSKLNVPDWAKFFKNSEGELLWMGLLFIGIIISVKKEDK